MKFEKEGIADIYDLVYADKDYVAEADFIDQLIQKFRASKVTTVLDVGCGTGKHAHELSKKGYELLGIDFSEQMIKKAKENFYEVQALDFRQGDIRDFTVKDKYDACLCMFVVLGYMTENDDIESAFKNIRKNIKKGGLFIFDIWNGLAVLKTPQSVRVKTVEDELLKVIRIATPNLRAFKHRCDITYNYIVFEKDKSVREIEEVHNVRFFFPLEMEKYLEDTGFAVEKIFPFLDLDGTVNEEVFHIGVVARAI